MRANAELVPMGTITAQLGQRIEVGDGPKGTRLLVDVTSVEVESDRLRASLAATDAADWLTVGSDGSVGCVDVRLTLKPMTAPTSMSSTAAGPTWPTA